MADFTAKLLGWDRCAVWASGGTEEPEAPIVRLDGLPPFSGDQKVEEVLKQKALGESRLLREVCARFQRLQGGIKIVVMVITILIMIIIRIIVIIIVLMIIMIITIVIIIVLMIIMRRIVLLLHLLIVTLLLLLLRL